MGQHILVTTLTFLMPLGISSEAVYYLRGKHWFSATKLSSRNVFDFTKLQHHSKFSGQGRWTGTETNTSQKSNNLVISVSVQVTNAQRTDLTCELESVLLQSYNTTFSLQIVKQQHDKNLRDRCKVTPYSPVTENKGLDETLAPFISTKHKNCNTRH